MAFQDQGRLVSAISQMMRWGKVLPALESSFWRGVEAGMSIKRWLLHICGMAAEGDSLRAVSILLWAGDMLGGK